MKIGVAVSSFAFWVKKYPGETWINKDQIRFLKLLKGKIEAVEINSDYESIKKMMARTKNRYKQALKPFEIKTLHLHWVKRKNIEEKEFNKLMKEFLELTGIKYCVIHIDIYINLGFEPKFPVAIENVGHGKQKKYPLKSLSRFKKPVVIDIDHTEELGAGTFDKQKRYIQNKIVEMHFSVPENRSIKGNELGYHHLVYKSGFPMPKKLPKNALWIIEGVIPKNRWDLFEKEIKLIGELEKDMEIIRARIKDAKKISSLRKQTILKVNSKYYGIKIIDYLIEKNKPAIIIDKIKQRDMFCIWNDKNLIGTVDLEKNKIGGLFIRYDSIGKGIGTKLMNFIENHAKKKGIKTVKLYPTKNALNFYKKLGYRLTKRTYWKTETFKVRSYEMEKRLK